MKHQQALLILLIFNSLTTNPCCVRATQLV